jgi:toxin-antitoxin system PIN domain toxin
MKKMLLPDVNLWLALAFDFHSHHAAANTWYEGSSDPCTFCRWTQQGFLRLATNPSVFKENALSCTQAWRIYDKIMSDPRITFANEPIGLDVHWRAYTQRRTFSPNVWSDAYLAAFAQAASFELVTFDKGFAQYKNVNCTILS